MKGLELIVSGMTIKIAKFFIPMKSGINSINVGVAASIIMFDAGIKKGKI